MWLSSFPSLSIPLLRSLQLDSSDSLEPVHTVVNGSFACSYFRIRFANAPNDDVANALMSLCDYVAAGFLQVTESFAPLSIPVQRDAGMMSVHILDSLVEVLRNPALAHTHAEVVFLINRIVLVSARTLKSSPQAMDKLTAAVSRLVPEYLSPAVWSVPTSIPPQRSSANHRAPIRSGLSPNGKNEHSSVVSNLEDTVFLRLSRTRVFRGVVERSSGLDRVVAHSESEAAAEEEDERDIFDDADASDFGSVDLRSASGQSDSSVCGPIAPALIAVQRNAVLVALAVRGIADVAEVMGSRFKPLLADVLYPLLERLGDGCRLVQHAAAVSLSRISEACEYTDLTAMLVDNGDYIVDTLALNLRTLGNATPEESSPLISSSVPCMIQALLERSPSPSALFPLLRDTLRSVVDALAVQAALSQPRKWMGATVTRSSSRLMTYLQVLKSIVTALRKYAQRTESKPENAADEGYQDNFYTPKMISTRLKSYLSQTELLLSPVESSEWGGSAESEEKADVASGPVDDGDDGKASPEEALAAEVVLQCRHFLSTGSVVQKALVLSILNECFMVLGTNRNALLPAVAQIWPSLCSCFWHFSKKAVLMKVCMLGWYQCPPSFSPTAALVWSLLTP